jgi:hypothetical protein
LAKKLSNREKPSAKRNLLDNVTLEQLVVLSNSERINSVHIHSVLSQPERLFQVNKMMLRQMKLLLQNKTVKKLK